MGFALRLLLVTQKLLVVAVVAGQKLIAQVGQTVRIAVAVVDQRGFAAVAEQVVQKLLLQIGLAAVAVQRVMARVGCYFAVSGQKQTVAVRMAVVQMVL